MIKENKHEMGRTNLIRIDPIFHRLYYFLLIEGKKDWKTLLLWYFLKMNALNFPKQIEDQILKTNTKILTYSKFW